MILEQWAVCVRSGTSCIPASEGSNSRSFDGIDDMGPKRPARLPYMIIPQGLDVTYFWGYSNGQGG